MALILTPITGKKMQLAEFTFIDLLTIPFFYPTGILAEFTTAGFCYAARGYAQGRIG